MPFYSFTLLFVVYCLGSYFFPCIVSASVPTLLIVLKPTTKPEERELPLDVNMIESPITLKEASFLFINTNCTDILDCDTNTETIAKAIKYLKTSVQMEL